MKGLKVLATLFVAQFDSTAMAEPGQRTFDDVASSPKSAAVRGAARTEQWLNAHRSDRADDPREAVTAIADQGVRLATRTTTRTLNRGHGADHLEGGHVVAEVGRRGVNDQRQAVGIGDHMTLAAFFRPIRGVRSGVAPPKTARTEAESMTAYDRSTSPSLPSRVNKR